MAVGFFLLVNFNFKYLLKMLQLNIATANIPIPGIIQWLCVPEIILLAGFFLIKILNIWPMVIYG